MDLGGANILPWPRGLSNWYKTSCFNDTLKSGCLRGTLRWFKGAWGALRGSKINLGGANVLPGPRGLRIGATLDASMTF